MESACQESILECHVALSSFGERFGYALWLFHLRTGKPASNRAVGLEAGRTGEAIAAWLRAPKAPDAHSIRAPTARFLGVDADWLFDEKGDPPRPDLWDAWTKARHRTVKQLPAAMEPAPSSAGKGEKRNAG
jgi:hypothetical protein